MRLPWTVFCVSSWAALGCGASAARSTQPPPSPQGAHVVARSNAPVDSPEEVRSLATESAIAPDELETQPRSRTSGHEPNVPASDAEASSLERILETPSQPARDDRCTFWGCRTCVGGGATGLCGFRAHRFVDVAYLDDRESGPARTIGEGAQTRTRAIRAHVRTRARTCWEREREDAPGELAVSFVVQHGALSVPIATPADSAIARCIVDPSVARPQFESNSAVLRFRVRFRDRRTETGLPNE